MPAAKLALARYQLRAGDLAAEVVPEIGGSLASFYSVGEGGASRHWLRPVSAEAATTPPALAMASFPLVPWCNRIRDGRFEWNGQTVQLAPNVPGSPHTLHGLGWQRCWEVEASNEYSIDLLLNESGQGAWPFPFFCRMRYALDNAGLDIVMELTNTGGESMPAGLGHHPYFPHGREGAGTIVTAQVDAIWLSDLEVMPTVLDTSHPAVARLPGGLQLAKFPMDNNFTGYQRSARIVWPDGRALRVDASPPLDFMVLYTPQADDYFVLEAVSNCTDWINLLSNAVPGARQQTVGGASLAPGASMSITTRLTPLGRAQTN